MTKTKKIIFYILLVLMTATFLFTSYDKLSGDPMAIQGFAAAHLSVGFMYFIGVCEALGAIGLWIPKLRKWAAGGLLIILAGAVVTTALFQSVLFAVFPLIVGIILVITVRLGTKKNIPAAPAPETTPTL